MSSRSHPDEAGFGRANKATCSNLTSSQPTQHYGPSQANSLRQLRRDGDGWDDTIHPNCIYIA